MPLDRGVAVTWLLSDGDISNQMERKWIIKFPVLLVVVHIVTTTAHVILGHGNPFEEARQEVRAEMQGKLDEANAAQRKAADERKAAEDALESARANAEAELQEVNAQLDAARKAAKKAIVDGDKDLAVFNAYFVQAQELAGKMRNAFLAIREKDPATAEKMTNAVKALQGVIGGITA